MKDYYNDVVYIVLKRLYDAKKRLESYLKTGGRNYPSDALDIEHKNADLIHPIFFYTGPEIAAFLKIFGQPLIFPKSFQQISPREFLDKIEERIQDIRIKTGLETNFHWLGKDNYLTKKPRRKDCEGWVVV